MTRTARFAWGAVVVILAGVIALVAYALTGPSARPGVAPVATTSADVVAALSTVPQHTFDTVGVTAPTTPLTPPVVLKDQLPLGPSGKPAVVFLGAEYCPFCAAERWPLIVALSRFGHFKTLHNTQSAALSVFPGIQTFSFVSTSYASRWVTFSGTELYSTAVDANGAFTRIAKLTPGQVALVARYGSTGAGDGSYPFIDIDNRMVTTTSGFSPAVLVGQSQATVAGTLNQPGSASGQAIVASANYLTAGICQATGGQPATVCASKGVRAADEALGLS
jgi:hypothetical protein